MEPAEALQVASEKELGPPEVSVAIELLSRTNLSAEETERLLRLVLANASKLSGPALQSLMTYASLRGVVDAALALEAPVGLKPRTPLGQEQVRVADLRVFETLLKIAADPPPYSREVDYERAVDGGSTKGIVGELEYIVKTLETFESCHESISTIVDKSSPAEFQTWMDETERMIGGGLSRNLIFLGINETKGEVVSVTPMFLLADLRYAVLDRQGKGAWHFMNWVSGLRRQLNAWKESASKYETMRDFRNGDYWVHDRVSDWRRMRECLTYPSEPL